MKRRRSSSGIRIRHNAPVAITHTHSDRDNSLIHNNDRGQANQNQQFIDTASHTTQQSNDFKSDKNRSDGYSRRSSSIDNFSPSFHRTSSQFLFAKQFPRFRFYDQALTTTATQISSYDDNNNNNNSSGHINQHAIQHRDQNLVSQQNARAPNRRHRNIAQQQDNNVIQAAVRQRNADHMALQPAIVDQQQQQQPQSIQNELTLQIGQANNMPSSLNTTVRKTKKTKISSSVCKMIENLEVPSLFKDERTIFNLFGNPESQEKCFGCSQVGDNLVPIDRDDLQNLMRFMDEGRVGTNIVKHVKNVSEMYEMTIRQPSNKYASKGDVLLPKWSPATVYEHMHKHTKDPFNKMNKLVSIYERIIDVVCENGLIKESKTETNARGQPLQTLDLNNFKIITQASDRIERLYKTKPEHMLHYNPNRTNVVANHCSNPNVDYTRKRTFSMARLKQGDHIITPAAAKTHKPQQSVLKQQILENLT